MTTRLLYILLIALLAVLLGGCKQTITPSVDPEENDFYRIYRDIYKAYGAVDLDSTQRQLERYLEKFPENADGWAFYGHVCFKAGEYAKARVAYGKAITIDGTKGNYYSSLGAAYSAQNMIDSAERCLVKALELKDTSANTLLSLSMLYTKKHDPDKAGNYASQALAVADSSALVYSGLSLVYLKLGEKQRSGELFNTAVNYGLKDTASFRQVLDGSMNFEDFYRKNY